MFQVLLIENNLGYLFVRYEYRICGSNVCIEDN